MFPQSFPYKTKYGMELVEQAVIDLFPLQGEIATTPAYIKHEAFNLENELRNYRREYDVACYTGDEQEKQKVDAAFNRQLEMFLGEYMSGLSEFTYEYRFNGNNELQSDGWSLSAGENYDNAANEEKLDGFTLAVRQAEASSFRKIQSLMQTVKGIKEAVRAESLKKGIPPEQIMNGVQCRTKAILQSPAENYPGSPYSFVSFYEVVEMPGEKPNSVEYKVQVRNRKVFPSPDSNDGTTLEQHLKARDSWFRMFDNTGELAFFNQDEQVHLTEAIDLLAGITELPESANFDTLIRAYDQDQLIWQDDGIRQKLTSFAPEIQKFFDIFKQYKDKSGEDGGVDEKLENAFKVLLVKAKVHLDEDEANGRWGIEVVSNIRNGIAIEADILGLQLAISGSCGNIDFSNGGGIIGGISVNGLINALHTFSMPWDKDAIPDYSTGRTDLVVCSCGCKWYVKNEDSSTYKDSCPNPVCKKPQKCTSAPVPSFTIDSQEPAYNEN